MSRNRFASSKKRRGSTLWLSLILFFLLGVFFLVGLGQVSRNASVQECENLQKALTRSAVHAYAVTGRYPESLKDLTQTYGITYDPQKYVIDYEIIGSNLKPSITVIPLDKNSRFISRSD